MANKPPRLAPFNRRQIILSGVFLAVFITFLYCLLNASQYAAGFFILGKIFYIIAGGGLVWVYYKIMRKL